MNNTELMEQGAEYIMNTYARFPMVLIEGKGTKVWDADGKGYLDFVGGIAVCALGHANDELNRILQEQSRKLWHVSNLYWIEPQVHLARKLVQLSGLSKAFFCNSGAEANEAAIKLARKYFYRQKKTGKHTIIVFKQSFHGRTLATITATGQPKYQEGFAPLPEGFRYADFNDLASVEALLGKEIAAIIVEPIQAEGGIHPADPSFLHGLRNICDQNQLLLIFDEVQCGVGRTGSFFAYEQYQVKPDIVTLAKGIAGGFPLGVMLANEKAASGFAPGDHASTFGGNPLGTAVGNGILDMVGNKDFLKQVQEKGTYLGEKLSDLKDERIVALRGTGLIWGLELETEVAGLIEICRQLGLLLVGAGTKVVRWVPPLNVSQQEMDEAVQLFAEGLSIWQ